MLKKTFHILKDNPVLIGVYLLNMLVMLLILFVLYPKDMSNIGISENGGIDFITYLNAMGKMLFAILLIFALSLLVASGFGNMMKEAIRGEKITIATFMMGIKKFFVRILLSSLLLFAFTIVVSLVLMILVIMIALLLAFNNPILAVVLGSVLYIIPLIIIMPFVLLWTPSIVIDETGVMTSLKSSFKAGAKNYWRLLLSMLTIFVPIIVYFIFNYPSTAAGKILTPGYWVLCVVSAFLGVIINSYLYIIYHEYKNKLISYSCHPENDTIVY